MKSKRSEEKEDVTRHNTTQHKVYFNTVAIDVPMQFMTLDMHDIFCCIRSRTFYFCCGPLNYSSLYFLSVYCW